MIGPGQQLATTIVASAQVSFLLDLVILILSALVLSLVFARLKLAIVSGQILAGVIVGPYVLGWVTNPVLLNELSEVGVVLLLFIIGLELDPEELRRLAGKVTALTMLEVGIAFSFGLLAAYLLRLSLLESIIFSMTAAITSTAIVGRIFLARRVLKSPESGFLIGLLVIEDIIAVVFLIILSSLTSSDAGGFPYLTSGQSASSVGLFAALEVIAAGLGLIALGYGVSRYIAPRIINYLSHFEAEFEEIPFLFALGLGFLFAVVAAVLGYSPGIGAFIIGLSIRGKQSKFLEQRIASIKDLFLVLFFVSMGSLIDPFSALTIWWPLLLVVFLLLVVGKFVGGVTIGKLFIMTSTHNFKGEGREDARNGARLGDNSEATLPKSRVFGAWLIPRGEFSLIIGQLSLALGLIGQSFFSLIGVSVLVTTVVASIVQRFAEPKMAQSAYPFKGKSDGEEK